MAGQIQLGFPQFHFLAPTPAAGLVDVAAGREPEWLPLRPLIDRALVDPPGPAPTAVAGLTPTEDFRFRPLFGDAPPPAAAVLLSLRALLPPGCWGLEDGAPRG